MENEEQLSDDPEEQLRIENELLKLKLQAELGATFGDTKDLPPEIEQQFLQQVLAFHEHQKNAPMMKLQDYVGSPDLPLANTFNENELIIEWNKLEEQLAEKHLQALFPEETSIADKYNFVVKDLFPLDIMQPGDNSNWVFDYEEFHPNDDKEILLRTESFFKSFFENDITINSPHIAKSILAPAGEEITLDDLSKKVTLFHELFAAIKSYDYTIENKQVDGTTEPGAVSMAYVEGMLKYVIETDDHQQQEVTGPYKLYFQRVDNWWQIFSFHLHGFSLD